MIGAAGSVEELVANINRDAAGVIATLKDLGATLFPIAVPGRAEAIQAAFPEARVVKALNSCGAEYAYVNIYEDEEVYRALPKFANWPTFPQLYVKGEFIGGCDITKEMFQSGELKQLLEEQGVLQPA